MSRPPGPPSKRLNIALPIEVAAALKKYAKRLRVSQTAVVELSLRNLLADKKVAIGPRKVAA